MLFIGYTGLYTNKDNCVYLHKPKEIGIKELKTIDYKDILLTGIDIEKQGFDVWIDWNSVMQKFLDEQLENNDVHCTIVMPSKSLKQEWENMMYDKMLNGNIGLQGAIDYSLCKNKFYTDIKFLKNYANKHSINLIVIYSMDYDLNTFNV